MPDAFRRRWVLKGGRLTRAVSMKASRLGRSLAQPLFGAAIMIVLVLAVVRINWNGEWIAETPEGSARTTAPTVPLNGQLRGDHGAKVAVIEFSDFHCPFCRAFARDVKPLVIKRYVDSGLVVWAFRNLPLTTLHPSSETTAAFAYCAGSQGRLAQAHNLLFTNRPDLGRIDEAAALLHLDEGQLRSCLPVARAVVS